jgi:hypothetical protein
VQDEAEQGSPVCSGDGEAATAGGAEEFVGVDGSPVDPGGDDELLRQWGLERGGGAVVRPN